MTSIRFYVLSDTHPLARQHFACRLIAKSFSSGLRTYVNAPDREACASLDVLLWTFRDQSFIPHEIASRDSDSECPVLIGHGEEPPGEFQFLLNLTSEVPHFFSRFERAAEIVDQVPETRKAGRSRYRFYLDRGYPIETHNI